jgi:NAD(P)-dependent dehydrogenase (short-subunit alcohol dehydrogenase family)
MRILVIGSTGTIGSEVVKALDGRHEIVPANRHSGVKVNLDDPASIRGMYESVGKVDAVVVAAGEAAFAPLERLTEDDFQLSLRSKLMGQVNVVRFGVDALPDGGSFTLTSGVLARQPIPGGAAISLVNAGLEGFVRAAALELPRGLRINIVSPGWVSETLAAMGQDPANGIPAAEVAKAYVGCIEGGATGAVIDAINRSSYV